MTNYVPTEKDSSPFAGGIKCRATRVSVKALEEGSSRLRFQHKYGQTLVAGLEWNSRKKIQKASR